MSHDDVQTLRPNDPAYNLYASLHVRDLMARYQPDVLWNDINWPDAGNAPAVGRFTSCLSITTQPTPTAWSCALPYVGQPGRFRCDESESGLFGRLYGPTYRCWRRPRGTRARVHHRGLATTCRFGPIAELANWVVGRRVEDVLGDMGSFSEELVHEPHLRWLGPEKGVVHTAAWDLRAKAC